MKTRMFLITAALLICSMIGFAQPLQPFSAVIYNVEFMLRDICEVGNGLPDGTPIEIWWDIDSDGPDADDVRPTLCDVPPDCPGGPAGTVNYNEFLMNGEAQFIGAGYFATESAFTSQGSLPIPPRYYLVVRCSGGSIHYRTPVFTLASGGQEVYAHNWECFPCADVCEATLVATIYTNVGANDPTDRQSVCLDLCPGTSTVIKICRPDGSPFTDMDRSPVATVVPGCLSALCDVQCQPAEFVYEPTAWFIGPDGCWTNVVVGLSEGCACFTFEYFLATSIESFTGVAGDGEVALSWVTTGEVGVLRYEVLRDGEVVGRVASVNSSTSQPYAYTDETAENGTSYTYRLRVVNQDNSVSEANFEVNATPSFGSAIVTEYALHQNFPNPFNPSTSLTFDVVEKNVVTLKVFNAAGQEVATVANGTFDSGRHIVSFDAGNMPSGLYFYTVKIGNEFTATKKMLLVK